MGLFAYIDPGSGSMLIQIILAGLLSVPFLFRRAIGSGLRRIRGERDPRDESSEGPPSPR